MTTSQEGEQVLVAGGSGAIGSGIITHLLAHNYAVISLDLEHARAPAPRSGARRTEIIGDVTDEQSLSQSLGFFADQAPLAGLVYTVGRCPPGGFPETIRQPLSSLDTDRLRIELEHHVIGLLNMVKHTHQLLRRGGHIVCISSAITTLSDEQVPPGFNVGHYAAAKAGEDQLIRWLRRDPAIRQNGILIHRLAPYAVDTPFHEGSRLLPPTTVKISEVAERVLQALRSPAVIDETLVPAAIARPA